MSTAGFAALPQSAGSAPNQIQSSPLLAPVNPVLSREVAHVSVRRRGNMAQGKALEILGHALEYLQDSRMFLINEPATREDAEAVQLLASLSRQVFAECAEVKPLSRRWRDWIVGRPYASRHV